MRPGPPLLLLASWLLLVPASRAAPKDGPPRLERAQDSSADAILNLLYPGEESLRVLQDHLRAAGQTDSDLGALSRERALARLFALHDHDQSGRLDGLEVMWLLSRLASQEAHGDPAPDQVVLTVDRILESWDFNQDGVLEPPELFLGPWQGQALLAGPTEEEGMVPWASPPTDEPWASPPGLHSQEGPGEAPAAPPRAPQQQGMEASSWKRPGGAGQEAARDPQLQGAEAPASPGDRSVPKSGGG